MGNPQERLIWLAGFIDGEGNLSIHKASKKARPGFIQLSPRIIVVNTDFNALEFTQVILDEQGIKYNVRTRKIGKDYWRPCWVVSVESINPVLDLLNLIRPYLIVKNRQADVLMSFCYDRLKRFKTKYRDTDLRAWQEIKRLNQNPQRLHDGLLEQAEDIVRASAKSEEAGRNDQSASY